MKKSRVDIPISASCKCVKEVLEKNPLSREKVNRIHAVALRHRIRFEAKER
jgi:hypothetical protein